MTETLDPVAKQTGDTRELAAQLLEQARAEGVELIGPDGDLSPHDAARRRTQQ